MSKTSILTFVLLCLVTLIHGQNEIEIESEYNKQRKVYEIIATNRTSSSYVVEITFTELKNLTCRDGNRSFYKTVFPGRHVITTLKRKDENGATKFNFNSWKYPGKYKPKVKFDHPYLIPLQDQKSTKVRELTYLFDTYGTIDPPKNWYGLVMETTAGDTIYASRKGTVVVVKQNQNSIYDGLLYSSEYNGVTIEHKDGTFGDYHLFQDNGIFVEEGQVVMAGAPIGIIGGDSYASGSHLRFSVRYFHKHAKIIDGEISDNFFYWAYVPMNFYTNQGQKKLEVGSSYKAIHSPEIIMKEMSKKEKKNWKRSH